MEQKSVAIPLAEELTFWSNIQHPDLGNFLATVTVAEKAEKEEIFY